MAKENFHPFSEMFKKVKRKRAQPVLISGVWPPRNGKIAEVLKTIAVLTWQGSSRPSGQEDSSSRVNFLTRGRVPMWGLHTGGTFPITGLGFLPVKNGKFHC